tara:strand:+ start:956 stop:1357 length:402 start_codon:yes stop_codon:yes gene_type:complete
MNDKEALANPRVIVIQKLYSYHLNKETEIIIPKHRYKKFIKDVVFGSIEREELIENLISQDLGENINNNKTELIIRLMIIAAIYEFLYMHKTPVKVIISEYLKVSDFFVEETQKNFLNAILDKASKMRKSDDN